MLENTVKNMRWTVMEDRNAKVGRGRQDDTVGSS